MMLQSSMGPTMELPRRIWLVSDQYRHLQPHVSMATLARIKSGSGAQSFRRLKLSRITISSRSIVASVVTLAPLMAFCLLRKDLRCLDERAVAALLLILNIVGTFVR